MYNDESLPRCGPNVKSDVRLDVCNIPRIPCSPLETVFTELPAGWRQLKRLDMTIDEADL